MPALDAHSKATGAPGGRFAGPLLDWYDANARDLPWRRTDDPYRILVSEIMLQQTQVKTVVPYFLRFIERFPDPEALARAPIDDVLAEWKGLGYYRRARMLHQAALVIVERFDGRLPRKAEELGRLPGVGEYTAAAVASIAYGEPVAAVDGNILRVAARLFDIDLPAERASTKRKIAARLQGEIPSDRPGDFNQAMMELGATICSPRAPRCSACPVAAYCRALAAGVQTERPVRTAPSPPRSEKRLVAVAFLGGKALLVRRPDEGLLGGLWEFPNLLAGDGVPDVEALRRAVEDVSGARVVGIEPCGSVEHRFTHRIWQMDVYRLELAADAVGDGSAAPYGTQERAWADPPEVERLALPRAMQKVWEAASRPVQLTF